MGEHRRGPKDREPPRPAPGAARGPAPAPAPAPPEARRLLELQQLAGNRAVSGLAAQRLDTGAAAGGPANPGPRPDTAGAADGRASPEPPPGALGELGEGTPLEPSVASRFGSALGADLSDVRLHTGSESAAVASTLGARAFTYGHHVGFDEGEYRPGTPVGDAILAHELAHVEQQRGVAPAVGRAARLAGAAATAGDDLALENDADRAASGAVARLWGASREVVDGLVQGGGRLRAARPGLRRCRRAPLGPTPAASTGPDHHAGINRPTASQITAINAALNPTSTGAGGVALNWDGQSDATKRQQLRTRLLAALQANLNSVKADMLAMQQAKAAGNVLPTAGQEGAGRAAKRSVDHVFGALASSAVLTSSQESARAAFQFTAGVNLLDASDPSVRPLDAALRADLVDWMTDMDPQAQQAQRDHGFNRRRTGQGEPAFYATVRSTFLSTGSNQADLDRFNQFGFAYSDPGPVVLSQTALPAGGSFSNVPNNPGEPSPAERRKRWETWEVLTHEYIHTLEHPSFRAARQGNRILYEGFCELFTKAVLAGAGGRIATAKADGDPALRQEVEGGSFPAFDPGFVPDYDPGDYGDVLTQAEAVVAQVGMQAARAAFFLGHVEAIGLQPDGTMIDPAAPDAHRFLAPEKVVIPGSVTTVRGVAAMTGAGEADIVAANAGLAVGGNLPASAHSTGLTIPGTSYHRTVGARSGLQHAVETKDKIAQQHGVAEADIVRANPALASRQPTEGEWVLIPRH